MMFGCGRNSYELFIASFLVVHVMCGARSRAAPMVRAFAQRYIAIDIVLKLGDAGAIELLH